MGAGTTMQILVSVTSAPTPTPKILAQCPLSQTCLINVLMRVRERLERYVELGVILSC